MRIKINRDGFAMPMVVFMIVIMSIIAYAALTQSNLSLNLSYKQSYLQMARVASKAAVDFAQESFDSATCGNYTGTPETDLVENDNYRVTFKTDVINTSTDGYEKVVNGTGSVYLPKQSETARYVFDVRSEIIRTYALCKVPLDFGPTVWLDASDTSTLQRNITSTTQAGSTGLGPLDLLLPNDTVEEKVSDGTQGPLSWLSNDIEMHTCDSLEFAILLCSSAATRYLYNGFVFSNFDIPAGSVINSATLQLTGATPSGSGGSLTHRFYGLYNTSTNPHLPLFTSTGVNQVRNRITNASLRTTAYRQQSTNNLPPGNPVNFDVTSIVQEMVNNPNWDPTNNGGRIGFGAQRMSGSGNRKLLKNGTQLSISYTPTALVQSNNTENIIEWQDKSGNNNHARFAYGNQPTRQDNQINGLPVVRFNNGTLLSSLSSALPTQRELTVFAVSRNNFSTSNSNGRLITGMNSATNNDTTAPSSVIPLLRNGGASGFSSIYSGSGSPYQTNYSCGAACENTPHTYVSQFTIDDPTDSITATLKGSGATVATNTGYTPTAAIPPYTYSINQFYYGGRRNGSMAGGSGADYLNGDYAEIIIYDYALECREVEALEEYLRAKWNITGAPYTSTCPISPIPTL